MKLFAIWPRKALLLVIRAYQKTISPDHSALRHLFPHGYCRFSPSCSEYSYQVVAKYGLARGSLKAIWRVLRCNPWNAGGYDPVN